jgi:hypothetical protein
MIETKPSIMIKAYYEMDVNTKHLITWIGIDEIIDFRDADTFKGVVVLTDHQEEYYIHDATAKDLQFEIDKYRYMEEAAKHLVGSLGRR